jgi:hypothetical protein
MLDVMDQLVTLIASIVLGVSLAASCGLRAFLPLFVVGVGARLGLVDLGDAFEWLGHTPALLALGIGVVLELAGDKIPFVNHVLDLLATPLRALAGMLVLAATIVDMPIWVVALLAIIVGGGVALAVHVTKSGLRKASTVATAGTASPFHSIVEDVVCLFSTIFSMVFWVVALVIAAGALLLFGMSARAVYQRMQRT